MDKDNLSTDDGVEELSLELTVKPAVEKMRSTGELILIILISGRRSVAEMYDYVRTRTQILNFSKPIGGALPYSRRRDRRTGLLYRRRYAVHDLPLAVTHPCNKRGRRYSTYVTQLSVNEPVAAELANAHLGILSKYYFVLADITRV